MYIMRLSKRVFIGDRMHVLTGLLRSNCYPRFPLTQYKQLLVCVNGRDFCFLYQPRRL